MNFVKQNLNLSAFAEDRGHQLVNECEERTLRSSKSEGGCFGGFRRRNEGYNGLKPVVASFLFSPLKRLAISFGGFGNCDPTGRIPCVILDRDTIIFKILPSFEFFVITVVSIFAVIFFLWAAFLYMKAGGNEENVQKAKDKLKYGLYGVGVAIIAFTAFRLVASFLQ